MGRSLWCAYGLVLMSGCALTGGDTQATFDIRIDLDCEAACKMTFNGLEIKEGKTRTVEMTK